MTLVSIPANPVPEDVVTGTIRTPDGAELRFAGQGGRYVPGGDDTLTGTRSFINNPLTSDPVRYARNAAILEEDPTLGVASPTVER